MKNSKTGSVSREAKRGPPSTGVLNESMESGDDHNFSLNTQNRGKTRGWGEFQLLVILYLAVGGLNRPGQAIWNRQL